MESNTFQKLAEMRRTVLQNILDEKDKGRKVVGYYCACSPLELPLAAGAIVVPLCSNKEGALPAADNDLPQNLCPVVRTLYDLAITDTCPFFHVSDVVLAETTCDGKKKVYEFLQKIKPFHIMDLPQIPDLPSSLASWDSEVRRLKTSLEEHLGKEITDEALRESIHIMNEEAQAKKEFFDLNQATPALISGRDLLTVASNSEFSVDRLETISLLKQLTSEIRSLARQGYHVGNKIAPRILLTGCPVGINKAKVIELVEQCGGLIVAMENCGGYKTVEMRIDENDPGDPVALIASKYIKVPCSVMSPNERRMQLLERMIKDFTIGGVIDLTWQACHTYNIESYDVANLVNKKLGRVFLHLETNFSDADYENLRVRIEAFLEMVRTG